MTAALILAAVLTPSVLFAALRLWVTRHDIPEEERAVRRSELAGRFDTYTARIYELPVKEDR